MSDATSTTSSGAFCRPIPGCGAASDVLIAAVTESKYLICRYWRNRHGPIAAALPHGPLWKRSFPTSFSSPA